MSDFIQCRNDQKGFVFSTENLAKAREIITHYPPSRKASAVLALLDLAQRQSDNMLSCSKIQYVAHFLDMPEMRVREIASFYSMMNLSNVGHNVIRVCRTTPCWLRGSDEILKLCQEKLGISLGETTPDGKFTLMECECLGACANAPVVQINDDYFEDLTTGLMGAILDELAHGSKPVAGSQTKRKASSPRTKIDGGK